MLETIKQCRSCSKTSLESIISFKNMPLANALVKEENLNHPEAKFPLSLVYCYNCSLVQILESISPKVLFSNYVYSSSFSETMLNHVQSLVERLITERNLGKNSRIIEIASNDGYLLQFYKKKDIPVLGIEPAENIAKIAILERGIPTLVEFFDQSLADKLAAENSFADVIHANNVFAHVPDPNIFISGIKKLLKKTGVAIIEAPYLLDLIESTQFDTIYHEHFCYFSLTSVNNLVKKHGLVVTDVEHMNIHGGSLRYYISHSGNSISDNVKFFLSREQEKGILKSEFYQDFSRKVDKLRKNLVTLLKKIKKEGKTIIAYGASAKGSTLLNAFGIDSSILDCVVDRSTLKQGLYTPGNHLQIFSNDYLLKSKPNYVLLLTWNFKDEILKQQTLYRESGGLFIVPIPFLEIV